MDRVTLTQASRALGVPQHRLIHLCEKGVVVPDVHDARGRGTSRGFSTRNLFEFAVALEIRRLELPLTLVRAVLTVLRSFEAAAATVLPGFSFPDSLRAPGAPAVTALILDGTRLFFSLAKGKSAPTVFGGVELTRRPRSRGTKRPEMHSLNPAAFLKLAAAAKTRTEVDLSRIAADLPSVDT